MEVIKATVLGFCFGVRRAVDQAEKALFENKDKKVYSLGPLIHNEIALKQLSADGLIIVEEDKINDIENNSVVIIRAHGVAPAVIKILEEKQCVVIDATCPRVKASQKMVERFTSENDFVILTGDKNHGEVIGIAGYAGKNFCLIQNQKEAEELNIPCNNKINVILLSQTTFSQNEFTQIESILKQKFNNIDVMKTICPATQERQQSLLDLCKKVDGVLVIGGQTSSNTKRLYQTALDNCKYAAHIQSAEDIPDHFFNLNKIGITAGASTPDSVINSVEKRLLQSL